VKRLVYGLLALSSCAYNPYSLPSYMQEQPSSLAEAEACKGFPKGTPTGFSKDDLWHACSERFKRKQAQDERNARDAEARREYDRAEAEHICNGYNPSGCLSPAEKQQQQMAAQQARSAAECYYGDMSACNKYPGGPRAAAYQTRQMKLESCLNSFSTLPGTRDYYGTEHLACE